MPGEWNNVSMVPQRFGVESSDAGHDLWCLLVAQFPFHITFRKMTGECPKLVVLTGSNGSTFVLTTVYIPLEMTWHHTNVTAFNWI
jgi:hypothetical protein